MHSAGSRSGQSVDPADVSADGSVPVPLRWVGLRPVVEMATGAVAAAAVAIVLLGAVRNTTGSPDNGYAVLLNAGLIASTASALTFAASAHRVVGQGRTGAVRVPATVVSLVPVALAVTTLALVGGGQPLVLVVIVAVILPPYLLGRGVGRLGRHRRTVLLVLVAFLVLLCVALFATAVQLIFSPVLLGYAGGALVLLSASGSPRQPGQQRAVVAGGAVLTSGCAALVWQLFF